MNDSDQIFTYEEMAELERRRLVAASLRSTLVVLNSGLPIDKLLNFIVNQALPLLSADAVAIYRLQEDGFLTIQAWVGLSSEYIKYANIPLGKLATGSAAFFRKPVFITDISALAKEPDISPEFSKALLDIAKNYRSILSLPLEIRDERYGSLTLYFTRRHKLNDDELELAIDYSIQAALAIDNARLRLRVQQDAIAQERNRLARELHDSVTQNLFSASLIAETLPRVMQRDLEKGYEGLNELQLLTRGALAEMRSLLLELRPHAIEDTRLEELLKQIAEAASGRLRKPVIFTYKGQGILPVEVRLTFYRLTQEAVNNIIKHAEANNISIILISDNNASGGFCKKAKLTIVDDGRGFIDSKDSTGHLGFKIMKERAELIGAKLSIKSKLERGTTIQLKWELHDEVTP
jgi:two-component system nitrate/nitrite sensor histidine kinase NarX